MLSKKHLLVLFCILLIVVGFAPDVRAELAPKQQAVNSQAFTVKQALERLHKNNPSLQLAQRKLKAFQKVAQVSGAWPNLNLNYSRQQLFPTAGQNQDTAGLQVTIPLGGYPSKQKLVAKGQVILQQARINWLRLRVGVQFLRNYFKLCFLQKQNTLTHKLLQQFRVLRPILQARVKGGRLAAIQILRFDLQVEQQRLQIRRLNERIRSLSMKLAKQLGSPQLLLLPQAKLLPTRRYQSLSQLAANISNHPYIQYVRGRSFLAQAKINLAHSKAWPDLSLSLAYLHQDSTTGQPEGHGFVAGVTIPLPFFQRNQTGVQRAQASYRISRWQLQRQRKLLRLRVQQAYRRLLRGQARYKSYQNRILRKIPGILQSAQVVFRNGGSLTAYLDTYRSIRQYQQLGLSLQRDIRNYSLSLEESLGRLPSQ